MAGTKKDFTDHGYCQYSVGALHAVQLFSVAAIGAGVASTAIQARFVTPCRVKISAIGLYASALNTIDGSIGFNIVVGSGAYDTGATNATGTYTLTGTPTTGDNNTYAIGGNAVVAPQTTGNSLTVQAAADVVVINASAPANTLVTATSALGVVTLTAKEAGPNGNAITTTAASTGDTLTANQATLAGGAAASGLTTVQNDNATLPYYNKAATVPPQQIAGGGSGITTNFATAGQALFASDVLLNQANFPGIATATGLAAAIGDVPTAESNAVLAASDAVFQRGQLLTLRFTTPAGAGSVSNVLVSAVMEIRPLNWPPDPVQVQPNSPLQGFVTPANAVSGPLQTAPNIANVRPVSGVTF